MCVDKDPEYYDNGRGTSNDNQARLYPVEYRCGALPCPPYVDYREMLCVQCSKVDPCLDYIHGDECVTECPVGTHLNLTTSRCDACHELCGAQGCKGPTTGDCIGPCAHFRLGLKCVSLCPAGYRANSAKECFKDVGVDCEGTPGGSKRFDRCGVCGGDGQSCNQKKIYVHWGSTQCNAPSKRLYTGFMAGYAFFL